MEYYTTIEIDNCVKQISFKHALYMDQPLWEITLEDKTYLIRKNEKGHYVNSDCDLSSEVLVKIGSAIDYMCMKDAS